ncbi:hypothetical protein NDU88_001237 [Pleurodeles waltl]|uniref:Uncharacterized protein n=1 Tax=Pleurodeles waltl TaxID=8319 RepID=A0AAV7WHR5_PLEWA|nr:hypothetical protein NDU88_001237 [Pleurodeles waltl]
MARRPDLTSPAQLRGPTKITLTKPVGVHRSLRDHATTQLPAATRNYGRSFRPPAGLQARLSKASSSGVRNSGARGPDPRHPPGPRASPTLLQGALQGKLLQSPPNQQGSRNTAHSPGATTIRCRAPQPTPVIRGPQEGSSTLKPRSPGSKEKGPSRGPVRAVAVP